jgi:hypothetical protein
VPDQASPSANRLAPPTRAAQIETARELKAASVHPEEQLHAEHILQIVEDDRIIERVFGGIAGWRLKLGGMITRSGFAAGPEYFRRFADDQVRLHASIRASTRRYYLMETGLDLPHLASDHAFADFYAAHFDYPSVEYYCPGPNSHKTGRSNYLLEETSFRARFGLEPIRHLQLGAESTYLLVHVGSGRDSEFASADTLYSDAAAPGRLHQSDYLQGGGFAVVDLRDRPLFPHRGEYYAAHFTANEVRAA